mgnify:CR=1 FL=1
MSEQATSSRQQATEPEWLDELHVRFGLLGRLRLAAGRSLVRLGAAIRRLGRRMIDDAVDGADFRWGAASAPRRAIRNPKAGGRESQC